jgi:hypothetical protein
MNTILIILTVWALIGLVIWGAVNAYYEDRRKVFPNWKQNLFLSFLCGYVTLIIMIVILFVDLLIRLFCFIWDKLDD